MRQHGLYQPFIQDRNVRRLYQLKVQTKTPMTKLLNHILDAFFGAEGASSNGAQDDERLSAGRLRESGDAVKYSKDARALDALPP